MAGTKANRAKTKTDLLLKNTRETQSIRGLNRHRIIPRVQMPPVFGGTSPVSGQDGGNTSNFLQPQGDTMVGALAFLPKVATLDTSVPTNPSIDISSTGNDYSSYIYTAGLIDSDLRTILGATFSGQLLYLQSTNSNELVLKQGDGTDGGNIITGTGGDNILNFGQIVTMLFDPTAVADPGVSGAWRVVAGGSGQEPQAMFALLSADQTTNLAAGNHIEFDTVAFETGDLVLSTGTGQANGIISGFQVGRIYVIEYGIRIEGSSNAAALVVRPRINDTTDSGTFASALTVSSNVNESFLPLGTDIFVPTADTDTIRLEMVVADSLVNIEADSTYITIQTAGGGGSGSGGGASVLDQLLDVVITTPIDDQVLTFEGGLWVNKNAGAGGMQTDLSNMVSPTVPTVPLSMNDQEINGVASLDFDGTAPFIEGLRTMNFITAGVNISDLSTDGLDITVAANQRVQINGGAGIIAVFDELNSTQRVLDMQANRIRNVDKYQFSPVSSTDTAGTAEIYEETGFGNLRYVSNNLHVFVEEGVPTLLSIGNFGGEGGHIQDIAMLNFNSLPGEFMAFNGDMQLDGSDVKVLSGNVIRNMSDIGTGGAGNSISEGNSNVTVTDAGTGSVNITVDGTSLASFTTGVGVVFERPLSMVANNIVGTGDVTPNGNMIRNLGGSTTFWGSTFANRYYVNNTGNFLSGDSFGIDYHVDGARAHVFDIGGVQKMSINASEIDFLDDLNTNGNDLRMNNGDITGVDVISMNGSGSTIASLDFLTFFDSGGFINMVGSDILNVGDISGSGKTTTGEIEINGALNHDGSTLGFFGQTPTSRKNYTFLTGTESLLQVIGKLNELVGILGDSGSNYGLLNV